VVKLIAASVIPAVTEVTDKTDPYVAEVTASIYVVIPVTKVK